MSNSGLNKKLVHCEPKAAAAVNRKPNHRTAPKFGGLASLAYLGVGGLVECTALVEDKVVLPHSGTAVLAMVLVRLQQNGAACGSRVSLA